MDYEKAAATGEGAAEGVLLQIVAHSGFGDRLVLFMPPEVPEVVEFAPPWYNAVAAHTPSETVKKAEPPWSPLGGTLLVPGRLVTRRAWACVAARWRDGGGRNDVVVLWWRAQERGKAGRSTPTSSGVPERSGWLRGL